MRDIIIDKPESLQPHHKVTSFSLTFIFWIFILYLWQPLISLIAWFFGYKFFYEHMVELGGYQGFIDSLALDFQVIAIFCIVLVLWAKSNQWRFRGKNRRTAVKPVPQSEIAEYFKVKEDLFRQLQKKKNVTLVISDDMQILCPDIKDQNQ